MEVQTQQVNKSIVQYPSGTEFIKERDKADKIGLLIKGKVLSVGPESKTIYPAGSFLGITDVFQGRYASTYTAVEDCMICLFQVNDAEGMYEAITSSPDYCGLIVASLCKQLIANKAGHDSLIQAADQIYEKLQRFIREYTSRSAELKLDPNGIRAAASVNPYVPHTLTPKIEYYNELSQFQLDSVKTFYAQGNVVVRYHVQEINQVIHEVCEENKNMIQYISGIVAVMLSNSNDCMLERLTYMIEMANEQGRSVEQMIPLIDEMVSVIDDMEQLLQVVSSKKLAINRMKIDNICERVRFEHIEKKNALEEFHNELSDEDVLESVKDSLAQILEYSGLKMEECGVFRDMIQRFMQLPDKFSTDDESRNLKREISKLFYMIYEHVFLRAHNDWNKPVVVELFLKYGFIDERLLEKEQILKLWHLKAGDNSSKIGVYTIDEWLTLIYEKKRMPSKNEFDQFYTEALREELQQRKITEDEYRVKLEDAGNRLHYEIVNLFEYNNRVCSGRITTFVPILYSDSLGGNFERLVMTAEKINIAFQKIIDIDYSLFYREIFYINRELNIEKEYIMQEVMPEVILMPSAGSKGVVWQDITEKQRDSAARMILPIFLEGMLDEVVIKLCARFRWEICRTIQGSTWNDIKYKSLTSEYLDYLQFYRKNRDLSEEKKDKVKSQLLKCSNRTADVFAIDYEAWVKGESQGAIRLNKVARKIIAMYCPFTKEVRARLLSQPYFQEVITFYELERQKKAKAIANRYKMLRNHQMHVTQEMDDNLAFYQDM